MVQDGAAVLEHPVVVVVVAGDCAAQVRCWAGAKVGCFLAGAQAGCVLPSIPGCAELAVVHSKVRGSQVQGHGLEWLTAVLAQRSWLAALVDCFPPHFLVPCGVGAHHQLVR